MEMNQNTGWTKYPRPQMKRDSYMMLNDGWRLNGDVIRVPFPPESEWSEYKGELSETLHYEKKFCVPESYQGGRILLHFGAVDQKARVCLNGIELGENEGGYLPFSFDITDYVKWDEENLLEVLAKDDLSPDYPYGKQSKNPQGMWYTPVSGIWQSVWLEHVPENYIKRLLIEPELDRVEVKLEYSAPLQEPAGKREPFDEGAVGKGFEVKIELPDGRVQIEEFGSTEGMIRIENPVNWTPDKPYLYNMKIKAGEDTVESYFALRTIRIWEIDGILRVCLNNEPVFFHGVLDQGYFPQGIYLPESEEGYEKDILAMKELGYNMLRKHIKIEPDYFYYACDRLGMLVMQDMVNSGEYSFLRDTALPTVGLKRTIEKKLSKDTLRRQIFEEQTRRTIEHLYNHPCIVAYTIFNEGWGQFDSDEMYDLVKALDDTRLVDSTSGWFAQKKNDFHSEHIYFRLKKLKVRKRPLFVTECGGYKLLVRGHFWGKEEYGYGSCADSDDLTARISEMYEKMILPAIKDGVCGCIYTQLSDVEGEINGLYTYDREVCKVNKEVMREIADKLYGQLSDC